MFDDNGPYTITEGDGISAVELTDIILALIILSRKPKISDYALDP